MKFQKLYSLLVESSSFEDLPNKPPYGFFIHPNGDFTIATSQWGHYAAAVTILNEKPELKKKFYDELDERDKNRSLDDMMMKASIFVFEQNYNRVAIEKPTLYYSETSKYNPFIQVTNAQKRTIKDLAAFYQLETRPVR